MKTDAIFRRWAYAGMLAKVTHQTGARAVVREAEDRPLSEIWGLVPAYAPVVIRRTPRGEYRRAA